MTNFDTQFRRLVEILEDTGMSRREISDRLGKSNSYITQKLGGHREVKMIDVLALRQLAGQERE